MCEKRIAGQQQWLTSSRYDGSGCKMEPTHEINVSFPEAGMHTICNSTQSRITRTNRDDSVYISPVMNKTFMHTIERPLAQEKRASARIYVIYLI